MRSKHWVRVVAILAMVLVAFAACGEDTEPPAAQPTDEGPAFTTLEEGVLQVGSCLDYRPFEFVKKGEETGFDVELSEEIASRLGLEVEWITANFDTIFTDVDAGNFDMVAAASTITEERLVTVDFSDPYFNARQSLTVNTSLTPDITTTDDLKAGDEVGAQKGSTPLFWAEENLAPRDIVVKSYQNASQAFNDLEAGNLTGVINDEGSSVAEVAERPGLEVVEGIDTDERYGFAFGPESDELREAWNAALAEVIADGAYAEIFQKYFPGQEIPPEYQA
jgi:ABC-type amino acid transport substrate-binding protein